jgi:phosphoribosylanthranilate isomerase
MTRIKICGITGIAQAQAVIAAGADLMGVVLAPSRRRVSSAAAREIVRAVAGRLPVAGVFVNTPAEAVNNTASRCGLDYVQLSGDESWEYCRLIKKPVIRAVRISADWTAERLLACLEEGEKTLGQQGIIYLLDTRSGDAYGGTGEAFDRRIAAAAAARFPVLIAGGLDPENVGGVVSGLKPWGVDVSSGVETGGVKSAAKIESFVRAVRSIPE